MGDNGYIYPVLAISLINIAVPFIIALLSRPSGNVSCKIFRAPKIVIVFGTISFLFVPIYLFAYFSESNPTLPVKVFFTVVIIGFALMGAFLWAFRLVWRIELRDEYLYHRNILGIVRMISYNEINKVVEERERNGNTLRGYEVYYGSKNKHFVIDSLVVDKCLFLKELKQQMRDHKCKLNVETKMVGFGEKKKK